MGHDRGGTDIDHSGEALADLLGAARWEELAERLCFSPDRRPIPAAAWGTWGFSEETGGGFDELALLSAGAGWRLIFAAGSSYAELRRAMLAVDRQNPCDCSIWWWSSGRTATVALVDRDAAGRPRIRRMDIDRLRPDPVGLRQWRALAVDGLADADVLDSAAAMRRHVTEVLDQEGLTREFFDGFRQALGRLRETMHDGPAEAERRHDVALTTLLRLVFLYFLQLREALDGDRRFLVRRLRQSRADGADFYRDVLRPLFFGALNRPADERGDDAAALGDIPFLNGGLFEPIPAELQCPDLGWPNEVWAEVIEGLLERYHFAIGEADADDSRRAVDPEMLGRVFEGLMYGDARHRSGSFYTPKDVVRTLVHDALAGYLCDATALSAEAAAALVSEAHPPDKRALGDEALAALDSLRLLDPAVGTGAFLLEALEAIRRCRRTLGERAGETPGAEYRLVRTLIHEHLFGVDVQQTAVRLCELRLWLRLLTTMPRVPPADLPPLPNLSHRVCAGDSLLSHFDLRLSGAAGESASWAPRHDDDARALERIASLQREYLTTHGPPKREVRRKIASAEQTLSRRLLERRLDLVARRIAPLERLADSPDLFGEPTALDADQANRLDRLRDERAALERALRDLSQTRTGAGFSYRTRFAHVMAQGGFDVIVTNPPWVRAHRIDRATRALLRQRYSVHRRDLWPGADALGIRAPFGAQVDLSALFLERSLELLRPGGRLCALVPAKLMSSLHGTGVRLELARHDLMGVVDYSDGDRQMFEATTYPALLHVRKRSAAPPVRRSGPRPRRASRPPTRVTVWRGKHARSWQQPPDDLPALDDSPGAPWILVEPPIRRLFDQIREQSRPLGSLSALAPRRGLLTGRNEAFVLDDAEAAELLGDDLARWSRPVFGGRDISPWQLTTDQRILWPLDEALRPARRLPRSLRDWFEQRRDALENRSDHDPKKPLWQLFRLKEGLVRPKVVWRDLSPQLEAAVAPADAVPLNTVYFVPFASAAHAALFAALLNSEPVRAVAYALAERARGGWRRHFAWVLRLLPVPQAFAAHLAGEVDLESGGLDALGRRLAAHDPATLADEVDGCVAQAFGLGDDALEALAGWRLAQSFELGDREAA